MPQPRRKPAEPKDDGAVYATVYLLPNFKPGDRLDGKLDPAVLELVLERGDASREQPR